MQEKALRASSSQAPYASTASGMHCQPSSEHFVSFCSCFLDSAAFAATPAETPALETILGLGDEVTVMSKAAVSLTPQLDTRISAGLVLSSLLPKSHSASRRAGRDKYTRIYFLVSFPSHYKIIIFNDFIIINIQIL